MSTARPASGDPSTPTRMVRKASKRSMAAPAKQIVLDSVNRMQGKNAKNSDVLLPRTAGARLAALDRKFSGATGTLARALVNSHIWPKPGQIWGTLVRGDKNAPPANNAGQLATLFLISGSRDIPIQGEAYER